MKVAFWSNVSGKNGVTCNLACISIMGAIDCNITSTLIENHANVNNLENAFTNKQNSDLVKENNYYFNHTGIDNLMKRLHAKVEVRNIVKKSSISFLNNSIYYIPQSNIKMNDIFEYEFNQIIYPLLNVIDESSDVAFIDTSNSEKMTTKIILEQVDLVVVNLSQDNIVINHFFEHYSSLISKSFFIIGSYNRNSKYNLNNISRKYHISRENIAVIPYNVELKDSISEGRIIEFISRNYNCRKEDYNYYFITELKNTTNMIANIIQRNNTEVVGC